MIELEKALGYQFRQPELLRQALTHPSTGRPNYQRMEYLGDSILEFCVSDMLYHKYPDWDEGKLTFRRSALVCEKGLAVVARSLDLGRYISLGLSEEMSNGRDKASILSDSMEALLAAVYLDGGLESARSIILRLFTEADDHYDTSDNYKGALQNALQAREMELPVYRIIGRDGKDNAPTFIAEVKLSCGICAQGVGSSKQRAEQEAARLALQALEEKA